MSIRRIAGEDAAITVFVVALTPVLMLVAGLVYDGGRILATRQQARDLADNAARAAAQHVDLDALRSGAPPVLDPVAAEAAARDYFAAVGHDGEVTVTDDTVQVTVSLTAEMVLLQLAGIAERTVTGTGQARVLRGVRRAES